MNPKIQELREALHSEVHRKDSPAEDLVCRFAQLRGSALLLLDEMGKLPEYRYEPTETAQDGPQTPLAAPPCPENAFSDHPGAETPPRGENPAPLRAGCEALACPFCGGEAILTTGSGMHLDGSRVHCKGCAAQITRGFDPDGAHAIGSWNARTLAKPDAREACPTYIEAEGRYEFRWAGSKRILTGIELSQMVKDALDSERLDLLEEYLSDDSKNLSQPRMGDPTWQFGFNAGMAYQIDGHGSTLRAAIDDLAAAIAEGSGR